MYFIKCSQEKHCSCRELRPFSLLALKFPTAVPGLLQSSHLPLQHCEQGWVKPFEQVLAMYTSVAKEQLLMDIVPISFPAPCLSYSSVGPTG